MMMFDTHDDAYKLMQSSNANNLSSNYSHDVSWIYSKFIPQFFEIQAYTSTE
jgi:hypothetical protein